MDIAQMPRLARRRDRIGDQTRHHRLDLGPAQNVDDRDSLDILKTGSEKNQRAHAGRGVSLGEILGSTPVVEMVVPDHVSESPWSQVVAGSDLNMLVSTGGRERTEAEYRRLFEAAGFELSKIIPTGTPWSVVEGLHYRVASNSEHGNF
jgi:hypothetical protein